MANSNQHSLVVSIVVLVLAVMVVPGAVSQSQKCRKGAPCNLPKTCSCYCEDKIWTFQFGDVNTREEYVDPFTGEIRGFYVDIINAVCRIANKNCRTVYDPSANCWDSIVGEGQVGGFGIFNCYYDACVGWLPTPRRLRTFQFTNAVSKNKASGFVVAPGNESFDWTDLTGKKIGFIDGFFSDEECVARQANNITGASLPTDSIVYYATGDDLVAGVLAGEVDAGFDVADQYLNTDELVYIADSSVFCALDGPGLMMRKDNCLKEWFDPALSTLLASPEYMDICDDLIAEHGDLTGGDPDDICQ